jgi:DNA-binding transcriptional LysR family regulator
MPEIARDLFVALPPKPTAATPGFPDVVLWDSAAQPDLVHVRRVRFTLKADQGWTLKNQAQLTDGSFVTLNNGGAGVAVVAGTQQVVDEDVAGGGRRRLVATMAGAPTVWLHDTNARGMTQLGGK